MILSQSIIESGWGSSRFAQEGNALFGQWTWSGEGLKPKEAEKEGIKLKAVPPKEKQEPEKKEDVKLKPIPQKEKEVCNFFLLFFTILKNNNNLLRT